MTDSIPFHKWARPCKQYFVEEWRARGWLTRLTLPGEVAGLACLRSQSRDDGLYVKVIPQ